MPTAGGGVATLGDLSAPEKRRVARLVEQLLAVEKAHEAAQAQWREREAQLSHRAAAADRAVAASADAAAQAAADLAAARASLRARCDASDRAAADGARDLGAARADLGAAEADRDAARRRLRNAECDADHLRRANMDLDAANRALVEENALVQKKLMASLELLERYQDQIIRMGSMSRAEDAPPEEVG